MPYQGTKKRVGGLSWAWVRWGLEVAVAATLLLVLVLANEAIFRNVLKLVGIHPDSPRILLVEDSCGTEIAVPLALRENWSELQRSDLEACSNRLAVTATAKPRREVLLLVNDRVVESREATGLVEFRDVRLREGLNRLSIRYGDERLQRWAFPFFRDGMPVSVTPERRHLSLGGPSMLFDAVESAFLLDTSEITIKVPEDGAPESHLLRVWAFEDGSTWGLVQGAPGSDVEHEWLADTQYRPWLEADGFALVQLAADKKTKDPGVSVRRAAQLTRYENGTVDVSAQACLPEDHALVVWARKGSIEAPELMARLFGIQVNGWMAANDRRWRERRPVRLDDAGDSCVELEIAYQVPSGALWLRHWDSTFPRLPGDELVLTGFEGAVEVEGRPADEAAEDRLVWRGEDPNIVRSASFQRRTLLIRSKFAPRTEKSGTAREGPPEGRVLAAWSNLAELLPGLMRGSLVGIAAAAPVALMLWAFRRYARMSPWNDQQSRGRAGLLALLAFMLTLAFQILLITLTRSVVDGTGIHAFVSDPLSGWAIGRDLHAPIAVLAIMLVIVMLRAMAEDVPRTPRPLLRLLAAVGTLLLIGVALLVPMGQQAVVLIMVVAEWRTETIAQWLFQGPCGLLADLPDAICPLAALSAVWIPIGLLTFWIPVWWVLRAVVKRGPVIGAAVGAATLIFLIPVVKAAEVFSFVSADGNASVLLEWLGILSQLLPPAVLVVMVTLFLHGFSRIAGRILTPDIEQKLSTWTRLRNLLLVAVLIVWPMVAGLDETASVISDSVLRLMTWFQAYGAILALAAPLGLMLFLERTRGPVSQPYALHKGMPLLLTATFAGYLTLWLREPMSVLVLIAAGWYVFHVGVLGSQPKAITRTIPDLGSRLLLYRNEMHLLKARARSLEKHFSDGSLAPMELAKERAALGNLSRRAEASLGLSADEATPVDEKKPARKLTPAEEAKRQLLGWGPGSSPLQNGFLGAKAGLIVAAALQLLLPFDFSAQGQGTADAATQAEAAGVGWLELLRAVVVDPKYELVAAQVGESQLLAFLNALLNAVALWVIAGFIFGYAFHRIRGNDGFVKAVFFGIGVSIPYLLSRSFIAEGAGVLHAGVENLVPLLLFLLVLGVLVFDGKTLQRHGISLAKLPEIYGLRTSLGYVSFAGLLASVQPLLQLMGWMFPG